ncbi:type VI secretion system amidase effector protein Tae4 [Pseudomonas sp. JDS28PS106]|uniref:type VI secretion system amidase effector protein Tae4 n=1 Tax=Pseudomonas sp. JDS28PS106 TaxID=2497235 RepID=UPI002FD324DF
MAKPSFINLWNQYPPHPGAPACDGPWPNQCAIRLSIALCNERTLPVNSSTYTEPRCAHGHARGAESLANWLWKRQQLGPPKVYGNSAAERTGLLGKTGIIFFKDFYYQETDPDGRPSGDHIDLWNRGVTASSGGDYFFRAKAVWFWELT